MRKFYHKYFEGYEEHRLPKPNGKGMHIEYTYVGVFYRQEHTKRIWIGLKILYLLMLTAVLALFIHAATRPLACNTAPYVVICQSICLLGMIWLTWVVINYIAAPRNMKIYTYKSTSLQLMKVGKVLAVLGGATAFMVLVFTLLSGDIRYGEQLLCMGEYLAVGVLAFLMYWLEVHTPYEKVLNSNNQE